jgi:hypothetical protein
VASEDTEALIDTLNILNAQQQMAAAGADTGNPRTKGVVVDKKAGSKARAVSPTLTSNEKSRYESIFKILKNVIDPGPEAGKSSTTSRVKKEASVSGAAKEITEGDAKKQGTSFIDKLLAGLGILTFAKQIFGYLKKKLFGLLGKMGTFLKKSFLAAFKTAKKVLSNIGRTILKAFRNAGAAIGKVFDKLKNSKAVQALKGAIGAAFTRLKDVFTGAKNALMKHVNKLKNLIKPAAAAGAGGAVGAVGQPAKPSLFSRLKSGVKSFGSKVVTGTVNVAKATGGAIKSSATSVVKGAKAVGGAIVNVGKSAAKSAVGKAVKGLVGKGAGGLLKFLGGAARRIPILGPIIEGLFAANDIKKLKEQYADGELTEEELHQQVGRRAITGVGGAVGAGAGAILAGLLTSWTGPGAIVGAIAGGVLGDIAGRFLSGLFTDYIMPPEYTKSIGKFFTGEKPPAPAGGMVKVDDGVLTHGGKTVRINSKDDVLALKTGGPLDKLMNPSTLDIGSAQVFDDMRELGKAQLQTLVAIKNGINALVAGSGSSSSSRMEVDLQSNRTTAEFYKQIA